MMCLKKPTLGLQNLVCNIGEGPKVLSVIICVAVRCPPSFLCWCVFVASPVHILGVHVCVHVPLYLPHLGTQNCRNLATTSPGRMSLALLST